jgi:hypothetical protein
MLAARATSERRAKMPKKSTRYSNSSLEKTLPLNHTFVQVASEWKSDPCKDYKCLEQNGVIEKKLINPCVTLCGKVSLRLH